MRTYSKTLSIILSFSALVSACSTSQVDRLEWVGKQPPMSPVQPKSQTEPIVWPIVKEEKISYSSAASLFDSQSKAFFKDQRAKKVGDILTVKVEINDQAKLDNKTEAKRQETDKTGAPSVFGLENKLIGWLPGKGDPSNLIDTSAQVNNKGEGKIDRKEIIKTDVAAVITNIMPNGNMVIYGSQQVNVNFEQRELTVQGVIRPQDISPANDVKYSQIAEARISYGGAGIISDIQQPRVGSQVLDILSPF